METTNTPPPRYTTSPFPLRLEDVKFLCLMYPNDQELGAALRKMIEILNVK